MRLIGFLFLQVVATAALRQLAVAHSSKLSRRSLMVCSLSARLLLLPYVLIL